MKRVIIQVSDADVYRFLILMQMYQQQHVTKKTEYLHYLTIMREDVVPMNPFTGLPALVLTGGFLEPYTDADGKQILIPKVKTYPSVADAFNTEKPDTIVFKKEGARRSFAPEDYVDATLRALHVEFDGNDELDLDYPLIAETQLMIALKVGRLLFGEAYEPTTAFYDVCEQYGIDPLNIMSALLDEIDDEDTTDEDVVEETIDITEDEGNV